MSTIASSTRKMRRLTTLFPSEFLEEYAEELVVVERDRKLQILTFVWGFVFSFARPTISRIGGITSNQPMISS